MKRIDINCDVGEGMQNEALLFPLISSCNLACGGHAGDQSQMRKVISLAKKNNVKVGAHPSYPDRANFGRKSMSLSDEEFRNKIKEQLSLLDSILKEEGVPLNHIKAHGALYNDLIKDEELANLYLQTVSPYRSFAKLYVPYGSVIAKEALRQKFNIRYEAFGDRNYNSDLSLVSRTEPQALITEPKKVLNHLLCIIKEGVVKTLSGKEIPIIADTFCIHGDTISAYEILMYLSHELPKHQIHLKQ